MTLQGGQKWQIFVRLNFTKY